MQPICKLFKKFFSSRKMTSQKRNLHCVIVLFSFPGKKKLIGRHLKLGVKRKYRTNCQTKQQEKERKMKIVIIRKVRSPSVVSQHWHE